jgi:hypothetical protein
VKEFGYYQAVWPKRASAPFIARLLSSSPKHKEIVMNLADSSDPKKPFSVAAVEETPSGERDAWEAACIASPSVH